MSFLVVHRMLTLLAVAAAVLALPAWTQAAPVLEVFEPTGENLFARNIYICPDCTPFQFDQIQVPPGFEASSSSRENVVEAEVLSITVPPGVAPSLDLSLDIPGDDFFYVARLLDASILEFDPVLGPSILAQVERDTVFTYEAGTRIHEASDPQGNLYVLFGIDTTSGIDPTQPDALAGVSLPAGWSVSDRVLSNELTIASGGVATVFTTNSGANFQQYAVVPEPSTALLFGLGLAAIASRRRPERRFARTTRSICELERSPTLMTRRISMQLILASAIGGVLPGISTAQQVGHELLDASGGFPIVVWGNTEITTPEYDALVLPPGWLRNQPREGVGQTGQFLRSPGLPADGQFTNQVMFGFTWLHQASVVAIGGNLDPGGLLRATTVEKHHELEWPTGSNITILTSPEAVEYILVSRDAQRTSDTPTLPSGWTLEVIALGQDLLVQLPLHTTVIRSDNEDSFQGPLPAGLLPAPVPLLPTSGLIMLTACLLSIGAAATHMRRGVSDQARSAT